MLQVQLGATLRAAGKGRTEFAVEADNVLQLLKALKRDYPELEEIIERGVAVAIDGQIYNNAWLQPIPDGAEVFLMPKLSGG